MKSITSDQQQAFHHKTTGVLVLIVGCLLIACLGFLVKIADLPIVREKIQTKSQTVKPVVTLKGLPTCLWLKSGDKPSKCEIGLKTDDGKTYAINQRHSTLNVYAEIGSKGVEIRGQIVEAGPKEEFDIVGTIVEL